MSRIFWRLNLADGVRVAGLSGDSRFAALLSSGAQDFGATCSGETQGRKMKILPRMKGNAPISSAKDLSPEVACLLMTVSASDLFGKMPHVTSIKN